MGVGAGYRRAPSCPLSSPGLCSAAATSCSTRCRRASSSSRRRCAACACCAATRRCHRAAREGRWRGAAEDVRASWGPFVSCSGSSWTGVGWGVARAAGVDAARLVRLGALCAPRLALVATSTGLLHDVMGVFTSMRSLPMPPEAPLPSGRAMALGVALAAEIGPAQLHHSPHSSSCAALRGTSARERSRGRMFTF